MTFDYFISIILQWVYSMVGFPYCSSRFLAFPLSIFCNSFFSFFLPLLSLPLLPFFLPFLISCSPFLLSLSLSLFLPPVIGPKPLTCSYNRKGIIHVITCRIHVITCRIHVITCRIHVHCMHTAYSIYIMYYMHVYQ